MERTERTHESNSKVVCQFSVRNASLLTNQKFFGLLELDAS
jgi:hypothetical protein